PPQVVIAPPPVPPVTQIAVPPMMVKPPAPPPPPAPEAIAQQTELNITPPPQNGNITLKHGTHISISSGEPYAPELDLPDYRFPTLDLLEKRSTGAVAALDKEELEHNKNQIIQTLSSFNIEIQSISATIGPTVTLYEIVPAKGVKISKIKNLEDDIALNLAALGIRIIAPIPGKGTIGIEVPNANKMMVPMLELLASDKFVNNKMSLPIALGKKIDNENYIVDLATMPHLLMAGATGQGKSVGINTILVSLLYKKHPAQLKFVMIDPKKVELSVYRLIEEHFLAKLPNEEDAIITDIRKVIYTLTSLCVEMDDRYDLLKAAGARNIKEYNEKFIARKLNPENGHKYLPFIVLVIDEFADLIMTAGKEVEMPIARLAQLARAVGIHLIIATQRPSVNVITGIIKANFPARVAFKVSSKVDSRTILDTAGAEQLVGRGDMLISFGSEILRLQCAFVDTPEVERIVEFIAHQRGYPTAFMLPEIEMNDEDSAPKDFDPKKRDKLFEECARLVVQTQSGSTSNLQRRFNIGYNRAGRIMDELEAASIVGPAVGSKPRDVFISTEAELQQLFDTFM
ncbi:MAG: DNA translocase FtsK, partial [Chitinophagia bacterium]|nr:DNA translocase FtsK [Chitinophagia bacterium]